MPDFDEKAGLDVIKESMGLTDQDLAPESDGTEGETEGFEGEGEGQEYGGQDDGLDQEEPPQSFESNEIERREQARQQQPQRQDPNRRGDPLRQNTLKFDPRASFRQDKKGNLIDNRTGEIIARAGSEARIYQRVHKQASDYVQAVSRNIQGQMHAERGKLERAVEIGLGFEQELQKARSTLNQINAHQLPTDQLLEAAGLYKQAQTDPVGVLKNLLTRAALNGIDITQLGMPQGGIDAKGIADMVKREIQQAVGPMNQYTQQRQQERTDQQTQSHYLRQAESQVNSFFTQNPEATPYLHIFHAVLSQPQFQNMPLGAIWDKVQLHLIRNGVDPRRPPSQRQRQRLSGPPSNQGSRSLPNGQGMAPSGGDNRRQSDAGPAHPSMSYDAIIREVLGNTR